MPAIFDPDCRTCPRLAAFLDEVRARHRPRLAAFLDEVRARHPITTPARYRPSATLRQAC